MTMMLVAMTNWSQSLEKRESVEPICLQEDVGLTFKSNP